jgi:hypothetical protein
MHAQAKTPLNSLRSIRRDQIIAAIQLNAVPGVVDHRHIGIARLVAELAQNRHTTWRQSPCAPAEFGETPFARQCRSFSATTTHCATPEAIVA